MNRWNIFVRELEDMLVMRGLGLGHLDDRLPIHREKVRRLRQSLSTPKSFPVLNPKEMEEAEDILRLTHYEVLRLRAALLATALEEMLMDRIQKHEALRAAEECFPILLQALLSRPQNDTGLGAVRGDEADIHQEGNMTLETTSIALERANIQLLLATSITDLKKRLFSLQSVCHDFEYALLELEHAPEEIKGMANWQYYSQELHVGLSLAKEQHMSTQQEIAVMK